MGVVPRASRKNRLKVSENRDLWKIFSPNREEVAGGGGAS